MIRAEKHTYTLEELNQVSVHEFVAALGDVFEKSPWIAELAADSRPYSSVEELYDQMVTIVKQAGVQKQTELMNHHPNLGERIQMSEYSVGEQRQAGLKELTEEEFKQFTTTNQAYMEKFGFPFILAVRGKGKAEIYQSMLTRLKHDKKAEFQMALEQIYQIAKLRLEHLIFRGGSLMKNTVTEKHIYYGKGDVFAYRTYANPLRGITPIPESSFTGRRNIIFGTNVKVKIGGEMFEPSFTKGDNSMVVATDSMKNFIQRHLASYEGSTLEGFASYVAKAFLKKYPQMDSVSLLAEDIAFTAVSEISSDSLKTSDLVFRKSRNERTRASIEMKRTEEGLQMTEQSSSVLDLQLIKVSGNSFVGFVRDEYTTLPEDSNRPLFVYLNIHWVYKEQADAFGDAPEKYVPGEQIVDLATSVFHNTETPSIQNLLYEIGCVILRRFPQLLQVTFESQNHTWETVVSDIPNSEGKVYTEPRPPYGFQLFTVTEDHL